MKIFITGNSGSGKSTIAKKISKLYNIHYVELDKIVWHEGKKISHEKRRDILSTHLLNESWVMEGMSHSNWINQAYEDSDFIFLIQINNIVSKTRIIKRYIKKKLGFDNGHKENLKYLKNLFKIRKDYEKTIIPTIKQSCKKYKTKFFVVKNFNQIIKIIKNSNFF